MAVWLQIWGMILHGLFAQALPFPGPGSYPSVPPPPAGMLIWWEADVGNNCGGVACTNGASQDSWADQSGNGNNGVLTPVIVSSCVASVYNTNQINGKPAVQFNGTAGPNATCFSVGFTPLAWSGEITEFVVAKEAGTSATAYALNAGGNGSFFWGHVAGHAELQFISVWGGTNIGGGTAAFDTSWHQVNHTFKSSTGAYAFRIDRASDGSGTQTATPNAMFQVLGMVPQFGGIQTFAGQIAEFILYNRVLSGAEITTVETYLHAKYGL